MKMLIEENRKKKIHGQTYLIIDCLKTVYEIFNVQIMS